MRPHPFPLLKLATLFYAAVVLASWIWARLWGQPLLGEEAPTGAGLALGLLTGIGIVLSCHLAYRTFRRVREASAFMARFFGPVTTLQACWLAILSGFAEEVCFRGALWPQLGLVGTTLLFAICHVVPMRVLAGYPFFALLAGLALGLLRLETGSVWPPILAHATVNALNIAWLGAGERRRLAGEIPPKPPPPAPAERSDLQLPAPLAVVDESYPCTVWRYDLRVELTGTDRETLVDCLEHEELALFDLVPRETVYEELRRGIFVFARDFATPFAAFPHDLATLSTSVCQPLVGLEIAERYSDDQTTDDVRAWKIVAHRGEWVKIPLLIPPPENGKFIVDADREDIEVIAAHWDEHPRWFQDGMRHKHRELRDL